MPFSPYTPRKLPDPGSMIHLGKLLELSVREPDGTVVKHSWWDPATRRADADSPDLMWSKPAKALMTFPGRRFDFVDVGDLEGPVSREARLDMKEGVRALAERGIDLPPDVIDAARLYAKYAARPAGSFAQAEIQPYKLQAQGAAVTIYYRSDKWNGRNGREVDYYHDFTKSGSDKVSLASGRPPRCLFIKGPSLTVTERGIIN